MSDYLNISDFLVPVDRNMLSGDEGYKEGQIGKAIEVYEEGFPDVEAAHLVLVGCGEQRGSGLLTESNAADEIRAQFYNLYYWHTDLKLADVGNIRMGKSLADTYAALKMVIRELNDAGKMVVILGGSHDLTLAQYYAFGDAKKSIDATGVDSIIDINIDSPMRSHNFVMEMLTTEPNYLAHYTHIGFQSYFVHPRMLETMDKLRFDCFRVGHVKERIEEMEPPIRNSHLFSFDIAAIAHAFAPSNTVTPNGLNGEEACVLMQYAGMSSNMQSIGIYGYQPENDKENLTAKQISANVVVPDGWHQPRCTRSEPARTAMIFTNSPPCLPKWKRFFCKAKKPAAGGCSCLIKISLPARSATTCWPAPTKFRSAGCARRSDINTVCNCASGSIFSSKE